MFWLRRCVFGTAARKRTTTSCVHRPHQCPGRHAKKPGARPGARQGAAVRAQELRRGGRGRGQGRGQGRAARAHGPGRGGRAAGRGRHAADAPEGHPPDQARRLAHAGARRTVRAARLGARPQSAGARRRGARRRCALAPLALERLGSACTLCSQCGQPCGPVGPGLRQSAQYVGGPGPQALGLRVQAGPPSAPGAGARAPGQEALGYSFGQDRLRCQARARDIG